MLNIIYLHKLLQIPMPYNLSVFTVILINLPTLHCSTLPLTALFLFYRQVFDCGPDTIFHSFSLTFRWWRWRVTTGGWDFTPTITMAVSAGLTTLCWIMCPGLSGGRIRSAVIADVSTCPPAKVRTAKIRDPQRLNQMQYTHTSLCFLLSNSGVGRSEVPLWPALHL